MPGSYWKPPPKPQPASTKSGKEPPVNPFIILLAGSIVTIAVLVLAASFRRAPGAQMRGWRGSSPGISGGGEL